MSPSPGWYAGAQPYHGSIGLEAGRRSMPDTLPSFVSGSHGERSRNQTDGIQEGLVMDRRVSPSRFCQWQATPSKLAADEPWR